MKVCDCCRNKIKDETKYKLVMYGKIYVNKNIDLCWDCSLKIERFIEGI